MFLDVLFSIRDANYFNENTKYFEIQWTKEQRGILIYFEDSVTLLSLLMRFP